VWRRDADQPGDELSYLHDNQAADWLGTGAGGVDLSNYAARIETQKAYAQQFVNKFGERRAPLIGSNASNLYKSIHASVVAQTLFIGYLVGATIAHPVQWYPSMAQAYFGIQVRGMTAIIGVCSLALESFIAFSVSFIQSQPGASKFDGRSVRQEDQVAWVFMTKIIAARDVCRIVGILVQGVFVTGLFVDIHAAYADELDFTAFYITGALSIVATAILFHYVYAEASTALESLGYKKTGICCGGTPLNNSIWGDSIKYEDGLTLPSAGGRSFSSGGSYL